MKHVLQFRLQFKIRQYPIIVPVDSTDYLHVVHVIDIHADHCLLTSEMPFEYRFAGGPIAAKYAGWLRDIINVLIPTVYRPRVAPHNQCIDHRNEKIFLTPVKI